jgi:predicted aspartyl protease
VTTAVPFAYRDHLLTIPVSVCGVETRFVFDTGIGVNLVSESLAARVGCFPDGSAFTGQRMSGQSLTLPLGSLGELQVGASTMREVPVGLFDLSAMAGLGDVEGFVSLTCFRTTPVTIDYAAGQVVVEDERSLARRVAGGEAVAVRVRCDGPSTDLTLDLELPGGKRVSVEIDTGSDSLILDERLAADAGVNLENQDVRVVTAADETGHEFVRYFTTLSGEVRVSGAPSVSVTSPAVMFQRIICDGLVGDAFLRNFTATCDLANSRVIFARGGRDA